MLDQLIDIKTISGDAAVVIDRELIRAARAALGWTAAELARRSNLGIATIRRAETTGVSEGNMFVIQHAFEAAGVVFLEEDQASPGGGRGLRLRRS